MGGESKKKRGAAAGRLRLPRFCAPFRGSTGSCAAAMAKAPPRRASPRASFQTRLTFKRTMVKNVMAELRFTQHFQATVYK